MIPNKNPTGENSYFLTRRPGESIVIELLTGEQIGVTVLTNTSNQVRIGTDAPVDMTIVREERVVHQLS